MRILIIDRDTIAAQPLVNYLEGAGYRVTHETVRKTALDRFHAEHFDVIFVDPAPLPSVREFTMPLRWEQKEDYFYMILSGHHFDTYDVVHSGMNARISKPYDFADIERKLIDAKRLIGFMNGLSHGEGSLTDSRIFGQRALYQLVLSALDRAYRYNEQAFLLMIGIPNLDRIVQRHGAETVPQLMTALGDFLSKLHRLSDFLGRDNEGNYVLLILRPAADSEPYDAIDRFRTALEDFRDRIELQVKPDFRLALWSLPNAGIEQEFLLSTAPVSPPPAPLFSSAPASLGGVKKTEDFT